MKTEEFRFDIDIEDEYITVTWQRLPHAFDVLSRYPEFRLRFKYSDISCDTVEAMLRDMEVPDQLSRSIITRIAADPN